MTQVFIAYKRADADRVADVRQKLEALGVDLFIDHKIKGGDNYIAAINKELDAAVAALVFWSKAATALPKPGEQNFFLAEAQKAWRRDILIAATFDKVLLDNLPVPFNAFQTSDLSDWFGNGMPASHRGWQRLLEALGTKLGRPGLASLALALESGDAAAKRDFIHDFPTDIFAERFADEIVVVERAAFDAAMAEAQSKIERRKRDGERLLKECQRQFESQIARLRKGEDFVQPDPVKMLADEVTALKDQNEIYESKIDELQDRIEQSKQANMQAGEKISELTKQVEELGEQRALAKAATAESERMKSDLEHLQREGATKASELEKRATQIEALKGSLAQLQRAHEAQQRDVKKLQGENAELKSQLPGGPRSIWKHPRMLVAAGGVAGLLFGAVLMQPLGYFSASRDGDAAALKNVKLIELRTATLAKREAGLKQESAKLADEKKQLADAADQTKLDLDTRQRALGRREKGLAQSEKEYNDRAFALDQQAKQAAQLRLALNSKEKALNERDAVLRNKEQDLVERLAAVEHKEKSQLVARVIDKLGLKPPVAIAAVPKNSADECDALAGEQYDRDRPAGNAWQTNIFDAPLAKAMTVCQSALGAARSKANSTIDQRRILMEIGRVQSAQSILEAKNGNLAEAKKLFDQALNAMQMSAQLGSAHANYLLGTFYRGDISVKGTPSGDFTTVKDVKLAWEYFMKAANGGDPVGLTTVAFGYLLPDWTDKMVKQDIKEGRSYLDKALKTEFPRANFVLGLATVEGQGFAKDWSEGLKHIEFAYCKKDSSAQTFIKNHHLKAPNCS